MSGLKPAYLVSKSKEMKEVMDRLKGFKRIKDSVYQEFIEVYNDLVSSSGDFIKKENRLKLVRFTMTKCFTQFSTHDRRKKKIVKP